MIEWIKFDMEKPPESGIAHITVGTTGIIRHGYYDCDRGWFDQMDDPIRYITHYAEINLPQDIL